MALPSWLQLSAVSGSGDTQITITASTTEEFYERAYSLLISGHTKTVTIPVTQEPLENTLSIYPSSHVFAYTGGTFQYTVTSNSDWTITSHPNWIMFDVLSGTTGTSSVNVTVSTNYDAQKEGDIVFSAVTATASTHVTQEEYIPDPALNDYLTFNITSPGNIVWKYNLIHSQTSVTGVTAVISYSINDGEWVSIESSTAGTSFSVNQGDVVRFKGDNTNYGYDGEKSGVYYYYSNDFSETTARFTLSGNINSLIDSDDFVNVTALTEYAFYCLFRGCTGLTDASELLLPVENLSGANSCYVSMFYNCTRLTKAPELPATTLADKCYTFMFGYCTSLTTAPELPATTLADKCYENMFYGSNLTTPPTVLPATTLANRCYDNMFAQCTLLTTTPELPATTLADRCYEHMFEGCTSLTTAPELPATTLVSYCYYRMFRNCTNLKTAPELPATTLVTYCYEGMFLQCTRLNYVKCLATNISANSCVSNWLNGVSSTGTFVKNPSMSSWTTGVSGIPSGWTVQNAT